MSVAVSHPEHPTLTIVDHPLVRHKITLLRDRETSTKTFKELVDEIAMLMAYEATSDLAVEPVPVDTPLETTTGWEVAGKKLVLVPILRAGLGMVEGILRLIPSARVGHIGLYRDHDTLEPVDYYFKVPGDAEARDFLLLDPMLATGGSAAAAVAFAQARGRAAHPAALPRGRAGRRAPLGGRASGCAGAHRLARPRTQRARATSCPDSATPAIGCSARASRSRRDPGARDAVAATPPGASAEPLPWREPLLTGDIEHPLLRRRLHDLERHPIEPGRRQVLVADAAPQLADQVRQHRALRRARPRRSR